mmetsp:Transcript_26768/g.86687  ORF Transcript_26768/g.86687 Transcript_26768/m.86687 type:complete len:413 (-) Transcript_26768:341-1579(-)
MVHERRERQAVRHDRDGGGAGVGALRTDRGRFRSEVLHLPRRRGVVVVVEEGRAPPRVRLPRRRRGLRPRAMSSGARDPQGEQATGAHRRLHDLRQLSPTVYGAPPDGNHSRVVAPPPGRHAGHRMAQNGRRRRSVPRKRLGLLRGRRRREPPLSTCEDHRTTTTTAKEGGFGVVVEESQRRRRRRSRGRSRGRSRRRNRRGESPLRGPGGDAAEGEEVEPRKKKGRRLGVTREDAQKVSVVNFNFKDLDEELAYVLFRRVSGGAQRAAGAAAVRGVPDESGGVPRRREGAVPRGRRTNAPGHEVLRVRLRLPRSLRGDRRGGGARPQGRAAHLRAGPSHHEADRRGLREPSVAARPRGGSSRRREPNHRGGGHPRLPPLEKKNRQRRRTRRTRRRRPTPELRHEGPGPLHV